MDLDYVKVTGRFGLTVGDGPDPDETPDTIWCDEGQVRLVPLNTYTKVAGGAPKPWTAGHSVIDTAIDVNGYISWSGQPYVWMVDLTSDKVNPKVSPGKATHRVEFRNVRAGGVPVTFETQNVRLAADTVVDGVCDLTLLMPVPTGGGTPIVVGPRGVSIEDASITGPGHLELELSDGSTVDAGLLPVGPGGSDAGVASYVGTPGSATEAAVAAKIGTLKAWAKNPDQLVAGAVTYSAGLMSSAVVEWPDGKPGVLTITSRQSSTQAVTGYTVTRVDGGTTTTYTQPTITRDSSGNATLVPQITVA